MADRKTSSLREGDNVMGFLKLVPIRFYAYGLVVILALGGVWYFHHAAFTSGEASGKALVTAYKAGQAQAVAEYNSKLEAAQNDATAVTEAGQAKVGASNEANHETVRTITKIVHDTPSPRVCVLQSGSVKILESAINDANSVSDGSR